jgi:hypothetical protein
MKEKYFSSKYLILIIIIFAYLFVFSTTSLALIPGDFGSAGGGPPDGVVDFEDLMIFALAYGSTPSDPNWNPVCDIASEGGVLEPDGVIDFEDLMIFALHYGENECTLPPAPTLSDLGNSLQSPATYTVEWSSVTEATSYKFQEATSSNFSSGLQEYTVTSTNRSFSHTVSTDTTYYYRVAAVNNCGQSSWSNVENIEITSQTQEQITPGGMAYIWYSWPQLPISGFYNFDVLLTINVDPGVQSSYYWAHQFHFKNGDGGYMGLQTNGCMQGEWVGKMAIFSIWEALEAEPGPGASCEWFTGEGVGWSCRIPYEWVEGRTYRLRIWALGIDEQENEWWGAWIIDTSTSQETFIGKIKVPGSWQWLEDYSAVWVEYYGQVNDCNSIPYAKARFEQPVADNGSFIPQDLTPAIGTTCPNAQITFIENQGVIFETGGLVIY